MTTSRQTLARRSNKSRVGVPYLGISSDYKAYGVRINWTDARIVKITVRKDCSIRVSEVGILRGQLHEGHSFDYKVEAGAVIYFARSSHGNFYYLLRYNGHHFCCSCVAGQHNKECHHQEAVHVFLVKQQEAKEAGEPASEQPRVRYGMEEDAAWQCYPYYRINGGERQYFLDENGERVKIFSSSTCSTWLYLAETKSQVEADLWYQELCAKNLRETVEQGFASIEHLSDEQRALLSLAA